METNDCATLTVKQFLKWANVSRSTFYNEANAGRLTLLKVGKKTLITRDEAKAWLSRLPRANALAKVA